MPHRAAKLASFQTSRVTAGTMLAEPTADGIDSDVNVLVLVGVDADNEAGGGADV